MLFFYIYFTIFAHKNENATKTSNDYNGRYSKS